MSFLKERMPIVLEVSAALVNVLSLTGNPMAMRAATILSGCVGVASALCSPPPPVVANRTQKAAEQKELKTKMADLSDQVRSRLDNMDKAASQV